ncbi:hypothetical protein L1987_56252 [Smallanthus sonchifolius]|uniref:Uncharacterized protein n=1 Tax=Smallanthus sonchifolius TaxID=185202 RepID=A0ACB9EDA1_9ASTR|nr:hypothetical protein L1987_56252 [Smallanthus sonchifolius]
MGDSPSPLSGDYCGSPPPLWTGAGKRLGKKRKTIVYEDEEEAPLLLYDAGEEEEEEEEVGENVKAIGNVVRVSCVGGSRRKHFNGFETDGVCYQLEDTVLVIPDEDNIYTKPSVAIIKDISAKQDGRITVTGQRFYRLEVAENVNGERWESTESRELFYSFDNTEFPADSVMHKCRVYFIPPDKEIPRAKDQPGFIVRKVYDSKYKELTELVDTGYDDFKQHEINLLVEKTIAMFPQLAVTDEASQKSC